MTADSAGMLTLAGDPADLLPPHDILVYGSNLPVPSSQVDYGTTVLEIVGQTAPEIVSVTTSAHAAQETMSKGADMSRVPPIALIDKTSVRS